MRCATPPTPAASAQPRRRWLATCLGSMRSLSGPPWRRPWACMLSWGLTAAWPICARVTLGSMHARVCSAQPLSSGSGVAQEMGAGYKLRSSCAGPPRPAGGCVGAMLFPKNAAIAAAECSSSPVCEAISDARRWLHTEEASTRTAKPCCKMWALNGIPDPACRRERERAKHRLDLCHTQQTAWLPGAGASCHLMSLMLPSRRSMLAWCSVSPS